MPPSRAETPGGQPLNSLVSINIFGSGSKAVKVDSTTAFAKVGAGDGSSHSEQFSAHHPTDITDPAPIQPGSNMILVSKRTGLFCRLADITVATPLVHPARAAKMRGLLQNNVCQTKGLLCDAVSAPEAAVLQYTGSGMSNNGVPLVQSPNTLTIIASGDPACSAPNGNVFAFALVPGALLHLPGCPDQPTPPCQAACMCAACMRKVHQGVAAGCCGID